LPTYGTQQIVNKEKHTLEVLEKLEKNITKYNELPEDKRLQIDLTIVEGLLAHPDTELYMNVMGQRTHCCGIESWPRKLSTSKSYWYI